MQRSGAAAILMQKSFKDVEFLYPKEFNLDSFIQKTTLEPFSADSIEYLNAISKELNKDRRVRDYPDVATFAFFCRKANILQLKKRQSIGNTIRLGRGLIFHIAPSNVPVNFAYSLISGILSGNLNIVRVSSKKFEQVEIICEAINKLSQEQKYQVFSERLSLVRYDRHSSATELFSSICDVRIIWGGDETIAQIRQSHLPARSFDITFADRYSLCTINADAYINESSPEKIAHAFYNDTYLFDQNACTAPHLVIWLGNKENVEKSKSIFWDSLYIVVKAKYKVHPVITVDKLTSLYNQAVQMAKVQKEESKDNLIWRIELESLEQNIDEYRCTCGYFSEYHAISLSALSKIVNRKYQTLSYYGISKHELEDFILQEKLNGIDRIVPIGKTTDFSLTWDGYNLINTLSRQIDII